MCQLVYDNTFRNATEIDNVDFPCGNNEKYFIRSI